jgi:uncharacterized membrane protein YgcG
MLLSVGAVSDRASNGVRDDAHFFSADAIDQAGKVVAQIKQKHQRDLLVETFASIPTDLQDKFETQGKQKFFEEWSQQRARQQGVQGVYVLICKDPSHLQVAVGNQTAQRLFTTADRDELARTLLQRFRDKKYDQGLLEAAQFVQQRLDAHSKSPDEGRLSVMRNELMRGG